MGCSTSVKFTKKQWLTLITIGCVHLSTGLLASLQAPFYPQEAESKNVTSTEYGFVFGVYELAIFISSPIYGLFMDRIGAKVVLNVGIFISAACSIFFGLIDLVQNSQAFIILSFVIRIVEALGAAAATTSAFCITAAAFTENMAVVFSFLEIFFGIGRIAGPTIGGVLFAAGGYILPFTAVGSCVFLVGIAVLLILPAYESQQENDQSSASVIKIFKVPAVMLDCAAVVGYSLCWGFYSATLEPHIRPIGLTPVVLGFVFMTNGITYAFIAPVIGRLSDKFVNPKYIILLGHLMCIFSEILTGPLPLIPLKPCLELVVPGLICLGLSAACILVCSFIDSIRSAVSYGFSDSIKTYGIVSGLWSASFALGDFIGASAGGALLYYVGFQLGSLLIVAVHGFLFILYSTYIIVNSQCRKSVSTDDVGKEVSITKF